MIALMYHSISTNPTLGRFAVAPEAFCAQMAWLAKHGFRGKSVPEAFAPEAAQDPHTILLTFDDGYRDNYESAFEVLCRHGFTATIFVPSAYVAGHNEWEAQGEPVPLLDWSQITQMAQAGIDFGSHTATHLDSRQATLEVLREEVVGSKQALETHLGRPVIAFAYPYGYQHPELPGLLCDAGYHYAFLAATYGINTPQTDPYALHRLPIWGTDSLRRFAAKVRGWYRWRQYTLRIGTEARWLTRRLLRSAGHGA